MLMETSNETLLEYMECIRPCNHIVQTKLQHCSLSRLTLLRYSSALLQGRLRYKGYRIARRKRRVILASCTNGGNGERVKNNISNIISGNRSVLKKRKSSFERSQGNGILQDKIDTEIVFISTQSILQITSP